MSRVVSAEEVNGLFREAAETYLKGVLGVEDVVLGNHRDAQAPAHLQPGIQQASGAGIGYQTAVGGYSDFSCRGRFNEGNDFIQVRVKERLTAVAVQVDNPQTGGQRANDVFH